MIVLNDNAIKIAWDIIVEFAKMHSDILEYSYYASAQALYLDLKKSHFVNELGFRDNHKYFPLIKLSAVGLCNYYPYECAIYRTSFERKYACEIEKLPEKIITSIDQLNQCLADIEEFLVTCKKCCKEVQKKNAILNLEGI